MQRNTLLSWKANERKQLKKAKDIKRAAHRQPGVHTRTQGRNTSKSIYNRSTRPPQPSSAHLEPFNDTEVFDLQKYSLELSNRTHLSQTLTLQTKYYAHTRALMHNSTHFMISPVY